MQSGQGVGALKVYSVETNFFLKLKLLRVFGKTVHLGHTNVFSPPQLTTPMVQGNAG
jgi:hypothetical protein